MIRGYFQGCGQQSYAVTAPGSFSLHMATVPLGSDLWLGIFSALHVHGGERGDEEDAAGGVIHGRSTTEAPSPEQGARGRPIAATAGSSLIVASVATMLPTMWTGSPGPPMGRSAPSTI